MKIGHFRVPRNGGVREVRGGEEGALSGNEVEPFKIISKLPYSFAASSSPSPSFTVVPGATAIVHHQTMVAGGDDFLPQHIIQATEGGNQVAPVTTATR